MNAQHLGGNQLLPEAIAASLPNGSVLTDWPLASIRLTGRGGYYLVFNSPAAQPRWKPMR